ncbi:xylulokinase [Shouchella shacheensis]|uniref:xylulokinase n=1 Tax=Shouchella shacheensis TaxID=1649580 RepID=UPI0007404825|nr:FGGY family carbohydrate kinase [Shouchella shacheensis]
MSVTLVLDVGSTSVKGILLKKGVLCASKSVEISTKRNTKGEVTQQPEDWWKAVQAICDHWKTEKTALLQQVANITFSGQMQDVIMLGVNPVPPAILYSDGRAEAEAAFIECTCGPLFSSIRNELDGTAPFAKMLWLARHKPALYHTCQAFGFSAKDYLIYQMTGRATTDVTTASTTGMYHLERGDWLREELQAVGIDAGKLPPLRRADEVAGELGEEVAQRLHLPPGISVFVGAGDAGATTLAAGLTATDQMYMYLGTTGWIGYTTDVAPKKADGTFTLAHPTKAGYIRVAPLLNVGSAVQWAADLFFDGDVEAFNETAQTSTPGAEGLLFLPYLGGERCPVRDPEAKGLLVGLSYSTTKAQIARAVLEGVAFAFRQARELLGDLSQERVPVLGGGGRSPLFTQVLAEVLDVELHVRENSEYLAAEGMSWEAGAHTALDSFVVKPNPAHQTVYRESYERFKRLYPAFSEL